MPELPEVETVVRGLNDRLKGRTIESVDIGYAKSFDTPKELVNKFVIGANFRKVWRRQKLLVFELSSGWAMVAHLKMTGQFVYEKASEKNKNAFAGGHPQKAYEQDLPHKHTHVIFKLDKGTLYFNDLRKFGWIRLYPVSKDDAAKDSLTSLEDFLASQSFSPEPLSKEFTMSWLKEKFGRRTLPIKQVLMDQKVAAGIGNIYADEALFDARINPKKIAKKLTDSEITKLYYSIRKVLRAGIKHGGTTSNNYRNADGVAGRMQNYLKVYGREGLPCKDGCLGKVKRIKLGGRSTHYCPECQF